MRSFLPQIQEESVTLMVGREGVEGHQNCEHDFVNKLAFPNKKIRKIIVSEVNGDYL